jgi:Fe-S-cluster containining protein
MRPLLTVPDAAKFVHRRMKSMLTELQAHEVRSPLDPGFVRGYLSFLELFEKYQTLVVGASSYTLTCVRGCHHCCSHWVDNVYSFEAQIIAQELCATRPNSVPQIRSQLLEDQNVFDELFGSGKSTRNSQGALYDETDEHMEEILEQFYGLNRRCALLTQNQECSIYAIRPMMCRMYLCFSDPSFCAPAHPRHAEVLTYLLDVEEDASSLLDKLDARYRRHGSDAGLRSQVAKLLIEPI